MVTHGYKQVCVTLYVAVVQQAFNITITEALNTNTYEADTSDV